MLKVILLVVATFISQEAHASEKQMHKPRPPEKEKIRIGLPPVTAKAPANDLNKLPPPPPIQADKPAVELVPSCVDSTTGMKYKGDSTTTPCSNGKYDPTAVRPTKGATGK